MNAFHFAWPAPPPFLSHQFLSCSILWTFPVMPHGSLRRNPIPSDSTWYGVVKWPRKPQHNQQTRTGQKKSTPKTSFFSYSSIEERFECSEKEEEKKNYVSVNWEKCYNLVKHIHELNSNGFFPSLCGKRSECMCVQTFSGMVWGLPGRRLVIATITGPADKGRGNVGGLGVSLVATSILNNIGARDTLPSCTPDTT